MGSLDDLGPPIAFVGFSMGAIFGALTVASMPAIKAAVLVGGGLPRGSWLDDRALSGLLSEAASHLEHPEVLMINKTHDEFFPREGGHGFFDALPGSRKRLMFWAGDHDDWPPEAIEQTVMFLTTYPR